MKDAIDGKGWEGYSVSVVSKHELHFAERFGLATNVVDHVGR